MLDTKKKSLVELEIEVEDLKKQVKNLSQHAVHSERLLKSCRSMLTKMIGKSSTAKALVETINNHVS